MKLPRLFFGTRSIAVTMFLVNVAAVADNTSTPPPSNDLRHRLYLGRTQLVEAASDIDGTTYLLEIQLTSRKPTNVPSTIKVKVGSEEFEVPHPLATYQSR